MREPGVAQSSGKIERADHLRHTDAGFPGRACVSVGHVGSGFLTVHMQPLNVGAAFHNGESFAQHRRDVKNVRDAIALEHVGKAFCAGHFAVVAEHYLIASGFVGDPTAPVIGIAGATNMNSYTLSAAQSSARSLT